MIALVAKGGKKPESRIIEICGQNTLMISLPESGSERKNLRRASKLAKTLMKHRIRKFIPAEDFCYSDQLIREGLSVTSPLVVLRQFGAELAMMELERQKKKNACVALIGDVLTGELRRAAIVLAEEVRYLIIDAGAGGEMLACELRRILGVPVTSAPTKAQVAAADVCLCYSKTAPAAKAMIVLFDGETRGGTAEGPIKAELRLKRIESMESFPAGFSQSHIIAALYSEAAITKDEIEIGGLMHLT